MRGERDWVIKATADDLFGDGRLAIDRDYVGGKAASLLQLLQWHLPVPDFCCVTTEALEKTLQANRLQAVVDWMHQPATDLPMTSEEIAGRIKRCDLPQPMVDAVERFIKGHPDSYFAVRSSGSLEDDTDASFAGLYQTVLNVQRRSDILNAIRTCWAALFDERVLTYLKKRNINRPMGLAVVVQKQVPAEKSGVLFTVDPVRGIDKEMLIEACFGLGEALVSGQVTPDQYGYNWYADVQTRHVVSEKEVQCVRIDVPPFTRYEKIEEERARTSVLSSAEIKELVALGVCVQEQSGFPVDIEWAIADGQVYLLQSRPITRIGFSGIPGEWTTADFRDGGVSSSVCTPYMASLYKMVIDFSMADYLKQLGLPPRKTKDVWQLSFYGRPYWNMEAAKHYLSQILDFNERAFDQGLGIRPNYEGDGVVSKITATTLFYGLRALWALKSGARRRLKACRPFARTQRKRLVKLNAMDLSAMDDRALFSLYDHFINRDYFGNESTYFDFIYCNSSLNGLFRSSLAKLAFDMNELPVLLSGLKGVSHLAQIEGLWRIRDHILQSAAATRFWRNTSANDIVQAFNAGERHSFLDRLDSYLGRFGHHSKKELDLMVPRYIEEPAHIVAQLQDILVEPTENDPRVRNKRQWGKAKQTEQTLLRKTPFWRRRQVSVKLQQARRFLWWREELRDLSTKFYYHVRRITLEVEKRLIAKGWLQDQNEIFFLERQDVLAAIHGELSAGKCQRIVQKNKAYYRGFANFTIPDEIGERYSGLSSSGALDGAAKEGMGITGSAGQATGIARVIANIDDAERLQPGDILVTRCTDPGWTSKFSFLSGVVTETGGILSHAAVICREYGIPAILAVKNATRLISDGQVITIDGNSGQILFDVATEDKKQHGRQNSYLSGFENTKQGVAA